MVDGTGEADGRPHERVALLFVDPPRERRYIFRDGEVDLLPTLSEELKCVSKAAKKRLGRPHRLELHLFEIVGEFGDLPTRPR